MINWLQMCASTCVSIYVADVHDKLVADVNNKSNMHIQSPGSSLHSYSVTDRMGEKPYLMCNYQHFLTRDA